MVTTQKFSFKRGQKIHLDEIYYIQGLANDWFEEDYSCDRPGASRVGLTDYLVVTKDIEFIIKVKTK